MENLHAIEGSDPPRSHRYLIIDFEATCDDKGAIPPRESEIIEFAAVMVEAGDWNVVDTFESFVRPVRHPRLTTFCTALTSIGQADVDAAPTFPDAVSAFKRWLYQYDRFLFGSWGNYDLNQLRQDCLYHRVPYPIGSEHINLKELMRNRFGMKGKPGLQLALEFVGLPFVGTPHRGIDDARNIAALMPYIFGSTLPEPRAAGHNSISKK